MANRNAPHGFSFKGTVHGGAPLCQELAKAVAFATAIFINDIVYRVADGSIEATTNFTPATTLVTGVAMNWGALSKATTHQVIVDPSALFEAQDNDASTGILAADLGLNANAIVSGAGDASTLLSGHMINITGIAVGAGLDMHLVKLYGASDNAHGPNARIEILFNKHRYAPAAVGV